MTKNKKKNNRYLHVNNIDDSDIKDFFVNANTPLSAAKKIWRINKDLEIVCVKDINTDDIFKYSPASWTNNKGNKFK